MYLEKSSPFQEYFAVMPWKKDTILENHFELGMFKWLKDRHIHAVECGVKCQEGFGSSLRHACVVLNTGCLPLHHDSKGELNQRGLEPKQTRQARLRTRLSSGISIAILPVTKQTHHGRCKLPAPWILPLPCTQDALAECPSMCQIRKQIQSASAPISGWCD